MQGLPLSEGLRAGQGRVSVLLECAAPIHYAARRRDTIRLLNPPPYHAHYFGEKLHLNQNKKCVMFGVTHNVAVDGCSRKLYNYPQEEFNSHIRPPLQTFLT